MSRAATVLVALLAAPALAGCMGLDVPPNGTGRTGEWECPTYPEANVTVRVHDAPADVTAVTLVEPASYHLLLSCVGPPPRVTLPATGEVTASGPVVEQAYGEVRLAFEDRVVRFETDGWRVNGSGTLDVTVVDAVNVTWNGAAVNVTRTEALADPQALSHAEVTLSRAITEPVSYTRSVEVNSSWNRGAYGGVSVHQAPDAPPDLEPGDVPGLRVEVRLVGPGGNVTHEGVITDLDHDEFRTPALAAGTWTLELDVTPPDADVALTLDAWLRFDH